LKDRQGLERYPRIRLSKISLGKLGAAATTNVSFTMATPDWESSDHHPGAVWYRAAWETGRFNYLGICGQLCMQNLLSVLPCSEERLVFQAGSHLGVLVAMGAAAGCQGLTIEGNPVHPPFIQLTADINGWTNKFRVINAAVGEVDKAEGLKFGFGELAGPNEPGVVVPMVALDSVFRKYYPNASVNIGIIDVEGYEQNVLLGASQLLKEKRVAVWSIEVWFVKKGQRVTDFRGLQLLLDSGYMLYDDHAKKVGMKDLHAVPDTRMECKQPNGRPTQNCILEYLAVRQDLEQLLVPAFQATKQKTSV
jgi:FkbM family methyltransferase